MNMERTQEMVDAIHGSIAYSGIEQAIIGTPIFNRLHRILQNSLVYLTYPSNKVKRFEHSVGTMHLSGQFFFHSVCNSPPEVLARFFNEVNEELKTWNKNLNQNTKPFDGNFIHSAVRKKFSNDKVYNIPWPHCRLYLENMPANLDQTQQLAYCVVFQSVRLSGLLHDVGHLPYSHILEHALQSLYHKVEQIPIEERNKAHEHFLKVMQPYCSSTDPEFAIHERLGQQFTDKIFECVTDDLPKREEDAYYFLAAVLHFTKHILTAKEGDNTLFSDLHHIVAGTLDCDRMDYCCRDEYNAGTSKELPSYDRIFSSVSIVYRRPEKGMRQSEDGGAASGKHGPEEERERCCFVPSTKALREIEALLRRRWNIYATINYHHRVHKHELLFQEVLADLGLEEMNQAEGPPEELDDVLPLSISSIWQLVAQMNGPAPVEYIALQLDDSWLDTLLKYKYFEKYKDTYLSFAKNGDDVMWHRLDELISVKKHYRSLIKRSGMFRQFDEYVYNNLISSKEAELLKFLDVDSSASHVSYMKANGEYIFNRAVREITSDKELREELFDSLNQHMQDLVHEKSNPYHIMDCLLADCSFSMGIKQTDTLCIAAPCQDEKPFLRYSALYEELSCGRKLLPCVHIYYLPQYDSGHSEYCQVDENAFLHEVATAAGNAIIKAFQQVNTLAVSPKTEPQTASVSAGKVPEFEYAAPPLHEKGLPATAVENPLPPPKKKTPPRRKKLQGGVARRRAK